ncbi:cell division initiation protein [Paenibacillus sp. GCM10023250]|uniref:cell division initiation protein n=1 Tax=Paenibacillus sp. GCM10023250 TaxID=3252648 RepID=UPI00360E3809
MAYMNGNLALQPKRKPEQKPSYRETKKVVVKRRSIPVQEKLLYLFTILCCVVVAGVIIFRYAQIYQMEQKITTLTKQQAQMQLQIDDLISKREIANDPKVLKEKAAQHGYVMSDDRIQVQTEGGAPVASN